MAPRVTWTDIDSVPVGPIDAATLAAIKADGWDALSSGFSTEYKPNWTLWHSLRETVQNSLGYDTPVLTLRGGAIRLEPIGPLVDRAMAGDGDTSAPCVDGTHILAVDFNSKIRRYHIVWRPVSRLLRHPYQHDMREVHCSGGRTTTCTDGHSLFVIPSRRCRSRQLVKGLATSRPTSTLECGDPLLVPFVSLFANAPDVEYFDVFAAVSDLGVSLDVVGVNAWAESSGIRLTRDDRKTGRFCITSALGLRLPRDARFTTHKGRYPIPPVVPVDALAWLLGLYMAEGSTSGRKPTNLCLILSLGTHETALLAALRECCRALGLPDEAVSVTHPHATAVNVYIYSPLLALVFRDVFKVGTSSLTKRVPDFVFNLSARQQSIFIEAFRLGDGCRGDRQKRAMYSTSSLQLRTGLEYLFALHGIAYSVSHKPAHEATILGHTCWVQRAWTLYIYDGQREDGRHGAQSPLRRNNVGDASTVELIDVVPVQYAHEWVYDVSVPGCENFVAGESPFIYHNSLDETGAFDITVDTVRDRVMTIVTDEGAGFGAKALLLAARKATDARGRHLLRGQFGEGMKYAVLPVLRAGARVFIRTAGLDISFVEAPARLGGQELITVHILARANDVAQGTTVVIEGLDATRWEDSVGEPHDLRYRFVSWLQVNRPELVLATCPGGHGQQPDVSYEAYGDEKVRHLLDLPGWLFVRGIFVQKVEATFGYDLWFGDAVADKPLDPDRDRIAAPLHDNVSGVEYGRLLAGMPSPARQRWLATMMGLENKYHDYGWIACDGYQVEDGFTPHGATRLLSDLTTVFGTDRLVFTNDAKLSQLTAYLGYTNLHLTVPAGIGHTLRYREVIPSAADIAKRGGDNVRLVLSSDDITEFFCAVLDESDLDDALEAWRAFTQATEITARYLSDEATIKVEYFLELPGDQVTVGYYTAGCVGLNAAKLARGETTKTLIHECAHARSGADDLTARFEKYLALVGHALAEWPRHEQKTAEAAYAANEDFHGCRVRLSEALGGGHVRLDDVFEEHGLKHFGVRMIPR